MKKAILLFLFLLLPTIIFAQQEFKTIVITDDKIDATTNGEDLIIIYNGNIENEFDCQVDVIFYCKLVDVNNVKLYEYTVQVPITANLKGPFIINFYFPISALKDARVKDIVTKVYFVWPEGVPIPPEKNMKNYFIMDDLRNDIRQS
ncbi:hypothetical protein M0R19_04685 [Candidatus Pacearchaeota archaeon]|jgi:hypothetical protein|nr:hypothetical protein [Candidatus Pacearchaeota archaeon]